MSFPLSYTGDMVLYKPEGFNSDLFMDKISKKVNSNFTNANELTITTNFSYTKLPIKIVLQIHDDNTSIHCKYKISLLENNLVFLLSIVFALFFNYYSSSGIAVLCLVFGVSFYLLNTAVISKNTKALILNAFGYKTDLESSVLWQKQQQWMKNKLLCPACGEEKNSYSHRCVNCGLYFSKSKQNINKLNTSNPEHTTINYELIKKKK